MSDFLGLQILTDAQLANITGRPSVLYELDHPPHTWYRWDGSAFVALADGDDPGGGGGGDPVLVPGYLTLNSLAMALDGLPIGLVGASTSYALAFNGQNLTLDGASLELLA